MDAHIVTECFRSLKKIQGALEKAFDECGKFEDFFKPTIQLHRDKLKSKALVLMQEHADFAIERSVDRILWGSAFHGVIRRVRRWIPPPVSYPCSQDDFDSENVELLGCIVCEFLDEATGFYQNLLHSLQAPLHTSRGEEDDDAAATRDIRHHTLIYLGDLYRYKHNFSKSFVSQMKFQGPIPYYALTSARMYRQALAVCPDDGLPLAQLAVLHTVKNPTPRTRLNVMCYYLQSLMAKVPAKTATQNLALLFRSGSAGSAHGRPRSHGAAGTSPAEHSRMQLRKDVLPGYPADAACETVEQDAAAVSEALFRTFTALHTVLYTRAPLGDFETLVEGALSWLSWSAVATWHCYADHAQTVAAQVIRSRGPEATEGILDVTGTVAAHLCADTMLDLCITNIVNVSMLLRENDSATKQRGPNKEPSAPTAAYLDCAEYFTFRMTSQYCAWMSQFMHELGKFFFSDDASEARNDGESVPGGMGEEVVGGVAGGVADEKSAGPIPAVLSTYLAPVHVLWAWLLTDTRIAARLTQRAATTTVRKLWQTIALLLNAIVHVAPSPSAALLATAPRGALPEDDALRFFTPLHAYFQAHVAFSAEGDREAATEVDTDRHAGGAEHPETTWRRLHVLVQLGRQLAAATHTGLTYDVGAGCFTARSLDGQTDVIPGLEERLRLPAEVLRHAQHDDSPELALETDIFGHPRVSNVGAPRPPADTTQEDFMRRMARQRLEAEVRAMESSFAAPFGVGQAAHGVSSTVPLSMPPALVHVPVPAYVVVDTSCLTMSLPLVRALVASERFIVILPLVVLGALDGLKKGKERVNKGAREATRYLEEMLKQGSAYVRTQQRDESSEPSVPFASEVAADVIRLVSCCVHYAHHISTRPDLVVLLTSERTVTELAQQAGVRAERIDHFARAHGLASTVGHQTGSNSSRGRGRGHGNRGASHPRKGAGNGGRGSQSRGGGRGRGART
eukprot:m.1428791 g.1428791  ORF g.1428791 m.1428791 type:complete len:965 (-) comp25068_c0_seq1:3727-6621(-)